MRSSILLLLTLFITTAVFSQKVVLTDENLISDAVRKEINEIFESEAFFKKKNKKFNDLTGSMTVDIGVNENSKVVSFYKVQSDIQDINFIQFMSNYILEHKFKFKLQKQKRYKIRCTIAF
jgi:predicted component of type VI protein secretion system